jgi:hypothetical protein
MPAIEGWVDPRAGMDDTEMWKFLPHREWNSDPSVVLPIASRCTDWAIPAFVICTLLHHHQHWQNSVFWTTAFLRRFCYVPSGLHFSRFRNSNTFYRARSSTSRPTPSLEVQVSVFMSPSDRVTQWYPQAPGSIFVAGLRWRYSNPPPYGEVVLFT